MSKHLATVGQINSLLTGRKISQTQARGGAAICHYRSLQTQRLTQKHNLKRLRSESEHSFNSQHAPISPTSAASRLPASIVTGDSLTECTLEAIHSL